MGPWFGVIAGDTGLNFKQRMARIKINAKQRYIKKVLQLQQQ